MTWRNDSQKSKKGFTITKLNAIHIEFKKQLRVTHKELKTAQLGGNELSKVSSI